MGFKVKKEEKTFCYLDIYVTAATKRIDYDDDYYNSESSYRCPCCEDNRAPARVEKVRKVTHKHKDGYHEAKAESIGVGSMVYVLVERYNSGDTFGREEECAKECGWFLTHEEAANAISTAERTTGYFDEHLDFEIHSAFVDTEEESMW